MPKSSSINEIKAAFDNVPADFPFSPIAGSVSGTQAKFLAVEFDGKFYLAGCSPADVVARWENCEDLAHQFHDACLRSKAGKRSHMSEAAILDQYLVRLFNAGWVTPEESCWVIRRAAQLLGWPIPERALAKSTQS